MKKIFTLMAGCAATLISLTVSANPIPVVGCDTISNLTTRDTPTLYLAPSSTGYLSGNNGYGDVEKAEQFTGPLGGSVTGAFIGVGVVTIAPADSANLVIIYIYDGALNQYGVDSPGTIIGTTNVPLSQVAAAVTAQKELYVSFTVPPTLTSQTFFISVLLPSTAGDTIALLTNQLPTTTADFFNDNISGSLDGNGWERWSDNSWNAYAPTYGTFPYSFGNYIQAVTCGGGPLAAFQSSLLNNCTGSANVHFYNTSSNGADSVHWTFTGGTPGTSNLATPVVSYSGTGNYNVQLVAYGTLLNDTIHSVVYVYPAVTDSVSSTEATSSTAANGTATVIGLTGTPPFTYVWNDLNQDTISHVTGLVHGTYIAAVTDADGCFAFDTVVVGYPNGIGTINGGHSVQVYPSPATDVLNILWDAATTADLTITDVSGRVLGRYSVSNATSHALDIKGLSPGTYILSIRDASGRAEQSVRFTKL